MLYFLQYVLRTSVMVACRLRRGIPPYLGAASDEVGGFVDAEGWETEFCRGQVDRVHPDGDLVEFEHVDVGWVSARKNVVGALA